LWEPEPALTLFNTPIGDTPVDSLIAEIPTLELHHPNMAAVRIFGLSDSSALRNGLNALGYKFVCASDDPWLLFARSINDLEGVASLELDAADWRTSDDVYDAFFKAVGAPEWHGRNFNALSDSIATGGINKTDVPYRIIIRSAGAMSPETANFLKDFAELAEELGSKGCPVEIRIEQ